MKFDVDFIDIIVKNSSNNVRLMSNKAGKQLLMLKKERRMINS